MELAQVCHPGADVIGPLRRRRLRVRRGVPGRLDVEPDPERDALEAEVRALREALRVDGIAAQAIREGVNRLHEPWAGPRYYVREVLASIDHTAADIVDRTSRAFAPEATDSTPPASG